VFLYESSGLIFFLYNDENAVAKPLKGEEVLLSAFPKGTQAKKFW